MCKLPGSKRLFESDHFNARKRKTWKVQKKLVYLEFRFQNGSLQAKWIHKYVVWFIQHLKVNKWHKKSTIFSWKSLRTGRVGSAFQLEPSGDSHPHTYMQTKPLLPSIPTQSPPCNKLVPQVHLVYPTPHFSSCAPEIPVWLTTEYTQNVTVNFINPFCTSVRKASFLYRCIHTQVNKTRKYFGSNLL